MGTAVRDVTSGMLSASDFQALITHTRKLSFSHDYQESDVHTTAGSGSFHYPNSLLHLILFDYLQVTFVLTECTPKRHYNNQI